MERLGPSRSRRSFFRFGLTQLLLLFVVLSLCGGLIGPRFRDAYLKRQTEFRWDQEKAVWNALRKAIQDNDAAAVRAALHASEQTKLGNRLPGLQTAITNGQLKITELLLEHGVVPDGAINTAIKSKQTHSGNPSVPLESRLQMIALLLKHGADPHQAISQSGTGPLNAMELAVYLHEPEVADLLREHGFPFGPHEMAAFGKLDELKAAVEKDPSLLQEELDIAYHFKPTTLLSVAIHRGHREMATYLIEQGSRVDAMQYCQTLLHAAGEDGDVELVKLLLAHGAEVDARDVWDSTPLTHCASRDAPEVMALLIEAGANLNYQASGGRTALHQAALGGQVETFRLLLNAGADPAIKDEDGKTAADLAPPEFVESLPSLIGD